MRLDRPVEHLLRDVRRQHLDHRDLGFGMLVADLVIMYAVFSVKRRAVSIWMRDSAMRSRQTPCSEIRLPNATRSFKRLHISSSARSATPIARMQW